MTQAPVTPTPEQDPSHLISLEGVLSDEARALLDQGYLDPARNFTAHETPGMSEPVIQHEPQATEPSPRARHIGDLVDDAAARNDTRVLHAMSMGDLGVRADLNTVRAGRERAEDRLAEIGRAHHDKGVVVGRAAIQGAAIGVAPVSPERKVVPPIDAQSANVAGNSTALYVRTKS